jgi:hypothetical protein
VVVHSGVASHAIVRIRSHSDTTESERIVQQRQQILRPRARTGGSSSIVLLNRPRNSSAPGVFFFGPHKTGTVLVGYDSTREKRREIDRIPKKKEKRSEAKPIVPLLL